VRFPPVGERGSCGGVEDHADGDGDEGLFVRGFAAGFAARAGDCGSGGVGGGVSSAVFVSKSVRHRMLDNILLSTYLLPYCVPSFTPFTSHLFDARNLSTYGITSSAGIIYTYWLLY